jgi:hypothetical protein
MTALNSLVVFSPNPVPAGYIPIEALTDSQICKHWGSSQYEAIAERVASFAFSSILIDYPEVSKIINSYPPGIPGYPLWLELEDYFNLREIVTNIFSLQAKKGA